MPECQNYGVCPWKPGDAKFRDCIPSAREALLKAERTKERLRNA